MTKRQKRERERKKKERREAERRLLVFPWVHCCNTVILINIYLPGKVQRMIRLSVCVRARVGERLCTRTLARLYVFLRE